MRFIKKLIDKDSACGERDISSGLLAGAVTEIYTDGVSSHPTVVNHLRLKVEAEMTGRCRSRQVRNGSGINPSSPSEGVALCAA